MQESIVNINSDLIENSRSYKDYRTLVNELMENGQTTGNDHSDVMLGYTKLNQQRMKRLDKTTKLIESSIQKLSAHTDKRIWLVITEGWCGDAAQIVPVLNHLAEKNENLTLKLILRDENLEIMDQFLTNGGRSIPKIINLDAETLDVISTWGPRPKEVQGMVLAAKNDENADLYEVKTTIQKWYAKDKTVKIQEEALEALLQ